MSNLLVAITIIIAYALGHFGGYRMCRLRVRNKLRRHLNAVRINPVMNVTALLQAITEDLTNV